MQRMLGNQYFLARKYGEAIPHLESAARESGADLAVARRLVACYVLTGRIQQALHRILHLVRTGTLPGLADAPPELDVNVLEFARSVRFVADGIPGECQVTLALGALTFFDDPHLTLLYFRAARAGILQNNVLDELVDRLEAQLQLSANAMLGCLCAGQGGQDA